MREEIKDIVSQLFEAEKTLKDHIKAVSRQAKFKYSVQGANVYISTVVDIDKVKQALLREMPVKLRFRDKMDKKRHHMFVDVARDNGSHGFMFAVYFDGNTLGKEGKITRKSDIWNK